MRVRLWCCVALLLVWTVTDSARAARLKDIASISGVRQNQLIGYGLVVGLDGTGDDDKTEFTIQSLVNMLEKMGVVVDPGDVKVDNVAAVMVTAELPAFGKVGSRIDVVVSSIGNAESIQGGTLIMTPLKAPNGEVYSVAQGPISIGGFAFSGGAGGGIQKNHPTVGRIPGGAIIEQELPVELAGKSQLEIILKQPDFTTSRRIAQAIEDQISAGLARPVDSGTVDVTIPEANEGKIVAFISRLENVEINPDSVAKVILNERTGTIVIGEKVRISTIAVSHGNLSIVIKEQSSVSQPLPFSAGDTVVVPQTEIQVEEQKSNLILLPEGASIGDVIRGLNAIGVSPRDLIAIIQSIKAAGALHADLEII
jgi:flagellar P-ring protein precursor FlgI